jgi:hypothetical protein
MSEVSEARIEAAVTRVLIRAGGATATDFEKAMAPYARARLEAMDKMQYGGNAQATREANAASKAWIAADTILIEAARALAIAYHAEAYPEEAT